MKPYISPPLWTMLGFLSGWLYARPGIAIGIVWGIAWVAMLTWIMRDVEASRSEPPESNQQRKGA